MNSDSEAIEDFLAWLLEGSTPTVSVPSGEISSQETGLDEFGAGEPSLNYLDPLDSEEVGNLPIFLQASNRFSNGESFPFEFGDKPAVQDRFHTLLKRRLRNEIERNPPRFPWETEVYQYESEVSDAVSSELIPTGFWAAQFQNFDLPIALPEAVLTSLFERCQAIVQSSLKEGARLVQAVDSLFPGQSQSLNNLAGLVLASPSRSGTLALPQQSNAGFPEQYETATSVQQMVLSLLASREIMDALTLDVSADQPHSERQWLTSAGALTLTADYHPQGLRIQGQLPCQGSLLLQGNQAESIARRDDAGQLIVELSDPEPNQTYRLEVQLVEIDQPPVFFAVRLVTEPDF
jgi:hypothetical protein